MLAESGLSTERVSVRGSAVVSASSQEMAVDVGGPMAGSCVTSHGRATMRMTTPSTRNGMAPARPAMKMVAMRTSRRLARSVKVMGIS